MGKKLFMLFLLMIILVQSVSLISGETLGNEVEPFIDLDAVIEEAKGRSYFYDNMSYIFDTGRLQTLPEEYIYSMVNVLEDWAREVNKQIGTGKLLPKL